MGAPATERRQSDTPTRCCAWCGLVFTAEGWREERRRERPEQVTHGICDSCHGAWQAGEIDAPPPTGRAC